MKIEEIVALDNEKLIDTYYNTTIDYIRACTDEDRISADKLLKILRIEILLRLNNKYHD